MFFHVNESMDADARYRWQWVRSLLINVIGMHLPHINTGPRKWLFRLAGLNVGKGGFIGMGGWIDDLDTHRITIEDDVTVSFGVTLVAHGPKRQSGNNHILIRKGAYIGCNCTILPGVTIGEGAVIGAASVVTRDVPAGATAYGNPCRIVSASDSTEKVWRNRPQGAADCPGGRVLRNPPAPVTENRGSMSDASARCADFSTCAGKS
ncbi:MAG: hypothetical protein A3K19_11440 [Lentisphaerae bacterium RIFOXYB12_FULL_65_16]|nr:MAG: hypothetical protein A3K18_09730 [Lentisphaerae bacterium RIFOXYA12_64_32]OGV90191.1 MAG: hypothetical protein A3K19_11440 [Lentisphaerae bacterium RIFOXYB12_FULL_65_16]